jgi:hypothetical protein
MHGVESSELCPRASISRTVLVAPVVFATTHAKAAGAGCNEGCDNSYAEEKAQEKALKDGQKWSK